MGSSKPVTIKKRVDFPVYGLDFTADDTLIAAGGGGANRSGVKNNMVKYIDRPSGTLFYSPSV